VLPREILAAAERLLHSGTGPVNIECRDAVELIKTHDRKNTLIYLDPPYPRDTRNSNKLYRHEYTREGHQTLLAAVAGSKAHILISSYDNDLYNAGLKNWYREEKTSVDESHRSRTEVL
jgi:DNA adenine methylase